MSGWAAREMFARYFLFGFVMFAGAGMIEGQSGAATVRRMAPGQVTASEFR
jgi:hypothetical protein